MNTKRQMLLAGCVGFGAWLFPTATTLAQHPETPHGGHEAHRGHAGEAEHEHTEHADHDEHAEHERGHREGDEQARGGRQHETAAEREHDARASGAGGPVEHLRRVLEGLEHGMVALRELGRREALAMLERIANEVRGELGGREARGEPLHPELQIVVEQIEALRIAVPALREGERHDAADLLERGIRAREVMLEGRRDERAQALRQSGPNREQIIELMRLAEDIYRELGVLDRADMVARLTRKLWSRPGEAARARDHHMEAMEVALHGLEEGDRTEAAEVLRRALRAHVAELEGDEGVGAERVRRQAPSHEAMLEALHLAARQWRQMGDEEAAAAVAELIEGMRPHEELPAQRRAPESMKRENVGAIQEELAQMRRMIEELRAELRAARRDR